ncbi:MAG: transposase [Planctomycetaceae bacterium]|nr:transposase [Planctomycetaceae bacterium]
MLLTAAILTVGSRTVTNILRTAGRLAPGHISTYHRVFSQARLWKWRLGKIPATLVIEAFAADGVIHLAGDDTVDGHRGAKVFGKGCHRDAGRRSGRDSLGVRA